MQSDEYIRSCSAFRQSNLQKKKNETSNFHKYDGVVNEISLNLQDVSSFYNPWDVESRQLELQIPPMQILHDAWKDVIKSASNSSINGSVECHLNGSDKMDDNLYE